ncbi:carbon-monoxide dehydrogenase, catalytic subunit [Thermosinus carboxydivorans Nor1]|uniref:Carbon monoxide dehydrogenase n=1 Tax=Thermosinus carboxydivorans Nor1 TaxID=401526 RepID=A1HQH5_9FIRM|nr:anaerobic carbon-monoxide dehydrogenase catalytic subunit [Thermosinus carboxydivorans]EAX47781.1 carbon-monoxide dehydrogenase, catalytic subunit [Thermosinus carboxydivorans Nor1]
MSEQYHSTQQRISIHPSVLEMYEKIHADGISNVFDRYPPQEKIRCNFCLQGNSCQLCSHGPCRISDNAGATLGVCGIDRDAMAMRALLLLNVMGSATYTHHAYQAFRTLKSTAEGKTPFEIKDVDKLKFMCSKLGIPTNTSVSEMAYKLADALIAELHHDYDEPSKMIDAFAPRYRKKVWQELAIFPAGVLYEISDATASCLTNVDGDYVSLGKKALRLGIATIYTSQIGLEMVQDILYGTPMPHEVEVDLGIMDPDYVNIVFNGHQPWTGFATMKLANEEKWKNAAKAAGAKGIKVIGSIETGQELIQRAEMSEVFGGLTGNWLHIEPLLATGTVDVFAMDENCCPPNLAPYAKKYQVTLVSVNDIVRIPDLKFAFDYKPPEAAFIAQKLIELGIDNFKHRRQKVQPTVPKYKQKAIAGFSTEAVLKALGGKLDPLVDVIAAGKIKGVVALVNCTSLKNGPQDYVTVNLAKELIKRDILIVAGGCGCHALEVAGLANLDALSLAGSGLQEVGRALGIPPVLPFGTCTDTGRISMLVTALADHLDVDVPQLPIAVTAPQWLEQKATIDGIFAVAYGAYTHLAPPPSITGAPRLVKLLTEDVEGLTGGKVAVTDDPVEAANGIETHIMKKRKALGLS